MKTIPSAICHKIYDILVKHAGAPEDDRHSFVYNFSVRHDSWHSPTEYRCCTKWGFAGKFWWNNNRFYVSGPSPNEVSKKEYERTRKECEAVDALLAPLYQEFMDYRMTVGMLETIPAYQQHQGALNDQLRILIPVANRLGLQDAADFIQRSLER